jgi:hypothetical protein
MPPTCRLLIAAVLALQLAAASAGEPAAALRVTPLVNGLNTLSLTSAPLPAQAMLAHRENFNAHGFDVLTLYVQAPAVEGEAPQWQLVPVFDAKGEHLTLSASGGADCLLHDFRLLRPSATQDATLILADRELGESFATAAAVQFRFFKLKQNADGTVGRPVYYFEFDHARQAGKAYCDVGEALQAELGFAPYAPAER